MSDKTIYSKKKITVYVHDRKLLFGTGNSTERVYPVAVGKPQTPTPVGTYRIISKLVHPGGILGTRWMGLDIPDGPYGIHGTFQPESIGKAVSNGCIRMFNHDVEELFAQTRVGMTVVIETHMPGTSRDFAHYTVKPGDTLWKVSRQFGLSVDAVVAFNNLEDPGHLVIGQQLRIPLR